MNCSVGEEVKLISTQDATYAPHEVFRRIRVESGESRFINGPEGPHRDFGLQALQWVECRCSFSSLATENQQQNEKELHAKIHFAGAAAVAKPRACITASWKAGRTWAIFWFSRVGWTRLVNRTTKSWRSGSIQMLVPVKPVWPKACEEK